MSEHWYESPWSLPQEGAKTVQGAGRGRAGGRSLRQCLGDGMPRRDEVSLSSLLLPDRLLSLPHRCHKVVHVLVLDKGGGPERRPVNNVLICEPRPRPIHELSDPRPIDGAAFVGNDDVEAVWSLRLFPLVCALLPDRRPLLLWDESRDDIEGQIG